MQEKSVCSKFEIKLEVYMKKLFSLDYKTIDDFNFSDKENSIFQILERYSLDIGDYEQNEFTEAIFNRLGWSNKYKDTIFSFRTIICKIFEYYSSEKNSSENEIKLNSGSQIIFYFRNNMLEYKINGKRKDYYCYNKSTLYGKVTDEENALHKVMNLIKKDKQVFERLNTVAGLVDSLSNFTVHPGYPFNQVKGQLVDVSDSLNLMIDKIQNCVDINESLYYNIGKQQFKVEVEKLREWKEWFIKNQKSYCLDDIYEITDQQKIVGKKLFANQTLEHNLPNNKEEIVEYLTNIERILCERAKKMNNSIR